MSPRPRLEHLRKPQIVAAAAEVLYERGLFETRIGDIAERAGTSSATILYYFESKDRLLEEAVDHADREWYARLSERLERCDGHGASSPQLIEETSRGQGEHRRLDAVARDLGARAARPRRARVLPAPRPPPARADRARSCARASTPASSPRDADPDDVALDLSALMDGLGDPGHARPAGRQPRGAWSRAASTLASLELGCELERAERAAGAARARRPPGRGDAASSGTRPARPRVRPPHAAEVRRARGRRARRGRPARRVRRHDDAGRRDRRRRRRRAGRAAARAAEPPGRRCRSTATTAPIASGLRPEAGPLQFYNWIEYINQDVDQRLPAQVRRQGRDQHLHDDRRGGREARQRGGAVRRLRARDRVPRGSSSSARSCSRSTTATSRTWRPTCGRRSQTRGTTSAAATRCPTRSTPPGSAGARTSCPASTRPSSRKPWGALWTEGPQDRRQGRLLDDEHDG